MTEIERDAIKILAQFRSYDREFVPVVWVREDTGIPRTRFDEAARFIFRLRWAHFIPESNQKTLTTGEIAGAVVIGNQTKHLMCE